MKEQKRYPVYLTGHRPPDQYSRTWVPIFFDPELARLLIESFIHNRDHKREGNVFIVQGDFEMKVKCEAMDKVLDTPLTGLELDLETKGRAVRFKFGSWEEKHDKPVEEVEETNDEGETVVVKKKVTKAAKPKRSKRPDGFITITELCKKWGIKPLHARQSLRVSDVEKPEFGWAFDPKDEAKLKKICGVK